jgi:hypothetical protein
MCPENWTYKEIPKNFKTRKNSIITPPAITRCIIKSFFIRFLNVSRKFISLSKIIEDLRK